MENNNLIEKKQKKKIYTIGRVGFASVIWGPLAWVYLISKNFDFFWKITYAKNTLIYGISSSLLLLTFFVMLPEVIWNKIPNNIVPIVIVSAISAFMSAYQNTLITSHLNEGWGKQSGWKVTWIAILFWLLTFLYAMLVYIIVYEVLQLDFLL